MVQPSKAWDTATARLPLRVSAQLPAGIAVLYAIGLALGCLYALNYFVGQPHASFTSFIDVNGEHNLPTWFSSIQWFCAALLLWLFVRDHLSAQPGSSWLLLGFPLIFLAMSLDEIASIHEWVSAQADALLPGGNRSNTFFSLTGIWMFVVGLPFLTVFSLLAYSLRHYFADDSKALRKIVYGVLIMLFGALGVETASNLIYTQPTSRVLFGVVEEVLEMWGATTVVWGSYLLAQRSGFLSGARARSSSRK
jgi:hypothetical protein